MSTTDTRQITPEELEAVAPLLLEYKEFLWGQEIKTTPTLVHTVFGDGKSIVTLDPANSRPDYYIILADSSIGSFVDFLDFLRENGELVFCAIEEEWGNVDDQQYDVEGNEIETPDDVGWAKGALPLSTGSGYTTGYFNSQPLKAK